MPEFLKKSIVICHAESKCFFKSYNVILRIRVHVVFFKCLLSISFCCLSFWALVFAICNFVYLNYIMPFRVLVFMLCYFKCLCWAILIVSAYVISFCVVLCYSELYNVILGVSEESHLYCHSRFLMYCNKSHFDACNNFVYVNLSISFCYLSFWALAKNVSLLSFVNVKNGHTSTNDCTPIGLAFSA